MRCAAASSSTICARVGSEGFRIYQKRLDNVLFDALIEQIKSLNREIAGDVSLGRGFCIGHSYFCGRTPADPARRNGCT